jgi:hypothetical protein
MSLFKNDVAQDVWIESNCLDCYRHPGGCTILARALARDRKPREWDRNTRAATMSAAYRCNAHDTRPPVPPRIEQMYDDVPLFDVPEHDANLIPVEGWPDKPLRHKKGDDHA